MIDRDKVYSYMVHYHGPINTSSNEWFTGTCPYCGREKLAFNLNYLVVKCWRGCFKGFIVDMIQQYHGLNHFETLEFIESMETGIVRLPAGISRVKKSDLLLPTGYKTILTGDNLLAKRARTYLKSRGFDLNYMDRIGVGYCDESHDDFKKNFFGYIIIPFKKRGLLSYFIGRDFIGNFPRYKNPETAEFSVGKADVLFNEEAIYLETKIYLTEGWADAATLGRAGISMQGSTPSTIQKNNIIKSDVEQVVVVPDAKFFMNGLQTARDFISYKKVKVLNMDKFLEYGKKDVNEVGLKEVLKLEEATPFLDLGGLYKQIREHAKPKYPFKA